jgi:hypothetical protein
VTAAACANADFGGEISGEIGVEEAPRTQQILADGS